MALDILARGMAGYAISQGGGSAEDILVKGYYYSGSFYSDATHTTLITPSTKYIYLDLSDRQLYTYENGSYSIVSDASDILIKLAATFSASEEYEIGRLVSYNSELYRFTSAHSGNWTGTDVDVVTIDDVFQLYAPLASPAFTGVPTAPTAAQGTNTTQIATTAFVNTEIDYSIYGAIENDY